MNTAHSVKPLTMNQNDQISTENNTILNSNNNTNMQMLNHNNNMPIIPLMN